jgi:hypothetical protein
MSNNKVIWSGKNIEDLIENYRKHECLWNCMNDSYMDGDARRAALRAIAAALGFSDSSTGRPTFHD